MTAIELQAWSKEIEADLTANILAFWMKHAVDDKNGGFVGEITGDMQIHPDADKGIVLNARVLWTYASAYRIYRNPAYKQMADRAYQYITQHFLDQVNGGYYWLINHRGEPVQDKKQVYGQAFVIYGLAEYVRAAPNQEALDHAIALFELLEQYAYDPKYGGYIEALSRDWRETDDFSLSAKDLNEKKSMNTHLHMMEAYTNLYRVWQSDLLRKRLAELITLTLIHILDDKQEHFHLFFDEAWHVKSHDVSYGHDIEGSWLLQEAAEVLGDATLITRAKQAAVTMAEAALVRGLDEDGGLIYEGDKGGWVDTNKHWWPQAEAVVGFLNAYELTKDNRYLEASYNVWRFIDRCIIDKEHGEWYSSTDRDGKPIKRLNKVDAWKCPYHNGRMGFEVIERLHRINHKPA